MSRKNTDTTVKSFKSINLLKIDLWGLIFTDLRLPPSYSRLIPSFLWEYYKSRLRGFPHLPRLYFPHCNWYYLIKYKNLIMLYCLKSLKGFPSTTCRTYLKLLCRCTKLLMTRFLPTVWPHFQTLSAYHTH